MACEYHHHRTNRHRQSVIWRAATAAIICPIILILATWPEFTLRFSALLKRRTEVAERALGIANSRGALRMGGRTAQHRPA
jgi:hypothetical protein